MTKTYPTHRCGAPVTSITSKRYGKGGTGLRRKVVADPGKRCHLHGGGAQ